MFSSHISQIEQLREFEHLRYLPVVLSTSVSYFAYRLCFVAYLLYRLRAVLVFIVSRLVLAL